MMLIQRTYIMLLDIINNTNKKKLNFRRQFLGAPKKKHCVGNHQIDLHNNNSNL